MFKLFDGFNYVYFKGGEYNKCWKRFYQPSLIDKQAEDSFVCVCNSKNCDEIEPIGDLKINDLIYYTSTKDGLRFDRKTHKNNEQNISKWDNI